VAQHATQAVTGFMNASRLHVCDRSERQAGWMLSESQQHKRAPSAASVCSKIFAYIMPFIILKHRA